MSKKSEIKTIQVNNVPSTIDDVDSQAEQPSTSQVHNTKKDAEKNSKIESVVDPTPASKGKCDTEQPSTSQGHNSEKDVELNSTSKRKFDMEKPSTSQGHNAENDTEPDFKKICMENNFWDENKDVTQNLFNEESHLLKINQLQIGS